MERAVIFDMDGVIVDSERQWVQSETSFLKQAIPGWNHADFNKITGMGVKDLYTFLREEYEFPYSFDEFWERNETAGVRVYETMVSLIPGFLELAHDLKGLVQIGLASSSPRRWIEIVLNRFELETLFDSVVSADDVNGVGKPAPDIYLYAADQLKCKPGRCVAIEDSRNGALSAKSAGFRVIGFRNGFNHEQDLSMSDCILEGFEGRRADDIIKYID